MRLRLRRRARGREAHEFGYLLPETQPAAPSSGRPALPLVGGSFIVPPLSGVKLTSGVIFLGPFAGVGLVVPAVASSGAGWMFHGVRLDLVVVRAVAQLGSLLPAVSGVFRQHFLPKRDGFPKRFG